MEQELSTLCTSKSSPLNAGLVKVAYMITLHDRLVEIANEIGNDAELARIAGVSRSAVSQWRAGDVKSLKAISALRIQERTGYSARWLVLGIGPKKLVDNKSIGGLERQAGLSTANEKKLLAILKAFFETDDEGKENISEAVSSALGDAISTGRPEQSRAFKRRRGSPSR